MALSDVMQSFSIGSNNTQQNQQQQQQTTPGNIPQNTAVSNPGNNTAAPNGVIPPTKEVPVKEEVPLDEFKGLWETDPNKTDEPEFGLLGEINPQKIMEAAGKVNFAKVVKQEDLAAIQAGGEGAIAALGSALNSVSQTVYAQSAVATSKLIEQATTKLEQKFLKDLPNQIKKQSFSNTLRDENPAYSHPAAAPLVAMIENQMAEKYPTATPSELAKMSQDYFTRTFSAISGADKKATEEAKNTGIFDWEEELGVKF